MPYSCFVCNNGAVFSHMYTCAPVSTPRAICFSTLSEEIVLSHFTFLEVFYFLACKNNYPLTLQTDS